MIRFVNAKINIGLNVVSRRSDGYHNIETIFYPVGVYNGTPECPDPFSDILEIVRSKGEKPEFRLKGDDIDCPIEKNLVYKAYQIFSEKYEGKKNYRMPAYDVTLIKRIPSQAGLGGGSADASFTLMMLNELNGNPFTDRELASMALKLGADCPFFIYNEPAYAEGLGERLTPVHPILKGKWCLIVKSYPVISTKEIYQNVAIKHPDENLFNLVSGKLENWRNKVENDFVPVAFRQFPILSELVDRLYDNRAIYATMTGSGSAVYGIFNTMDDAELAKKSFAGNPDIIFMANCLL